MDLDKIKISIIGLGYVGCPLFKLFSKHFECVGLDMNPDTIQRIIDKEFDQGNPAFMDNVYLTTNYARHCPQGSGGLFFRIMKRNRLRTLAFSSLGLITAIMMVATVVEKQHGSDFVREYIYGARWMVALWSASALLSLFYIIKQQLYKQLLTFALHLSFLMKNLTLNILFPKHLMKEWVKLLPLLLQKQHVRQA